MEFKFKPEKYGLETLTILLKVDYSAYLHLMSLSVSEGFIYFGSLVWKEIAQVA